MASYGDRLGRIGAFVFFAVLAGCGGRSADKAYGDCYEMGTCECSRQEQCPEGQHCMNGHCGFLVDAEVRLKDFGEPCLEDQECTSGICLPEGPGNGGVCTKSCQDESCPDGWQCKSGGGRSLCVQTIPSKLCQSCSVDAHCNAFGDLCMKELDNFYCGQDCTTDSCPAGYDCTDVTVDGSLYRQCVPKGGTCDCTEATLGITRVCENSNDYGVCYGQQVCQVDATGPVWSACDAAEATQEICDGFDNDCDGLTDDADPGVDTSGLPADPAYPTCRLGSEGGQCLGRWVCEDQGSGTFDWTCTAAHPEDEVCNGRDDDCNGLTDDPFVDDQGRYVTTEDCGWCGRDCKRVLDHLLMDGGQVADRAAACEVRGGDPVCVPQECEPGYYPYPEDAPEQCALLVSSACRPCQSDGDCIVSSDHCVYLDNDQATFCLQSCDPSSFYVGCTGTVGIQDCCPQGSLCQDVSGQKLCMPVGTSCACNADRVGFARQCTLEGGGGTSLCQGSETCEQTSEGGYAWSECEASEVTTEVCDGRDNNCNGEVDEDFRNSLGQYDQDAHCGDCITDCLAQWNQDIQHAVGGCVFHPGTDYSCEIVRCTDGGVPGAGLCRIDSDCPIGWSCHDRYHQCVRACTGPGNCDNGQVCHDGWCATTCSSDSDCHSRYGQASSCDAGVCQVDYQFVNADELDSNGCECPAATQSGSDQPDIYENYPQPGVAYVDRDCDGVDGVAGSALFVWSGTDQSQGTKQHPYATIQEALAHYNPARHHAIMVAAGTYEGNIFVASGVRLFGGYSSDFSHRDVVLYPTVIRGTEPDYAHLSGRLGTVTVANVHNARTVVAGFSIYGYDVTQLPAQGQAGYSSYALYVKDCDSTVEIANNRVYGGRGGDGSSGFSGNPGASGVAGSNGQDSWECPASANCNGYGRQGGAGGGNSSCSSAAGQPGASSKPYNTQDPQDYTSTVHGNGQGGSNNTYAQSDPSQANLCKYDCQVGQGDCDGQDAQNGSDGTAGSGGSGCASGLGGLVNGQWQPGAASAGSGGVAGVGGGGGGAGGSVVNQNAGTGCTVGNPYGDLGATGGGGGAGGCGGRGGSVGGGGGGSFGIFVMYTTTPSSLPSIHGNQVVVGLGGSGGDGGAGGAGGRGGGGGLGGHAVLPAWCAGEGGAGGRGGDGGAGGGGGGGCGGAAFGIAGMRVSGYSSGNEFQIPAGSGGGAGGRGGPSPAGGGYRGSDGVEGQSGNLHSF
ncbi:MAG: hypothetical protein J7M25_14845 [Deltaproteobacteria bacterium]|nr:hypothetical protein [Deltaproteobacteria bacterium]